MPDQSLLQKHVDRYKIDLDHTLTREEKAELIGVKLKNYPTTIHRTRLWLAAYTDMKVTIPETTRARLESRQRILDVLEEVGDREKAAEILGLAPRSISANAYAAKVVVDAYAKYPELVVEDTPRRIMTVARRSKAEERRKVPEESDTWVAEYFSVVWLNDGTFGFKDEKTGRWTGIHGMQFHTDLSLRELIEGRNVVKGYR